MLRREDRQGRGDVERRGPATGDRRRHGARAVADDDGVAEDSIRDGERLPLRFEEGILLEILRIRQNGAVVGGDDFVGIEGAGVDLGSSFFEAGEIRLVALRVVGEERIAVAEGRLGRNGAVVDGAPLAGAHRALRHADAGAKRRKLPAVVRGAEAEAGEREFLREGLLLRRDPADRREPLREEGRSSVGVGEGAKVLLPPVAEKGEGRLPERRARCGVRDAVAEDGPDVVPPAEFGDEGEERGGNTVRQAGEDVAEEPALAKSAADVADEEEEAEGRLPIRVEALAERRALRVGVPLAHGRHLEEEVREGGRVRGEGQGAVFGFDEAVVADGYVFVDGFHWF